MYGHWSRILLNLLEFLIVKSTRNQNFSCISPTHKIERHLPQMEGMGAIECKRPPGVNYSANPDTQLASTPWLTNFCKLASQRKMHLNRNGKRTREVQRMKSKEKGWNKNYKSIEWKTFISNILWKLLTQSSKCFIWFHWCFPSEFRRLCIVLLIPSLYYSPLHSSQLYYNPQLSCVPESREISIINNICMSLQSQKLDFIQHLAFREANLTTRSRWNNISIFFILAKTETTLIRELLFIRCIKEGSRSWYKWRLLF